MNTPNQNNNNNNNNDNNNNKEEKGLQELRLGTWIVLG